METLKVAIDIGAFIPVREHDDDAGLDLYAKEDGWIFPFSRRAFDTGTHVAIPRGWVGLLTSKSGMMLNMGVTSRGTIDSGYNGSIRAVLFNHSWRFVKIKSGQKVTQLVLVPCATPKLKFVNELEETERGADGFGSTGR